jgi:hypothetical protein
MMQWGSLKLKNGSTALKMAACRRTVTSVPGDCQRAEMLTDLVYMENVTKIYMRCDN